jgi:acyl-homoserine lactone acylase PvdQ
MHRRFTLAAVLSTGLALALPTAASARDYARTALDIIPSGQLGTLPLPADADRQARMYDALTPLFNRVSSADLPRYFKSMRLGTAGQGPLTTERVSRAGVRIVRDGFHVPHIYGRTADDVTWATGWVIAEDRALLLEQARYNARVAAVDAPGLTAITLIQNLRSFTPSAQTERELSRQTNVLRAAGSRGRAVLHDIDVYITGINARLRASGSAAKPWTRNDVYAVNALKGQFLGQGGGDEARRSMLASGLVGRLGRPRGLGVFNDLRERQDPETPVSVPGTVPFPPSTNRMRGNVLLDDGSLTSTAVQALANQQAARAQASNVLMVSGRRSATGHPLMVGGPQIGYYYPGLTLEMDLHGPGIEARGATSAPFPGYILIGRAQDFAWTLTSAGLDIIDTYVETLCGGDDHHYLFQGRCRAMSFFDAGVLAGTGAQLDSQVTFYRTVHGPVVGYATVNGQRVAVSRKRASYGRDILDQLFYREVNRGHVRNFAQFARATNLTPQTFNSFYMDDRDIGVFTSGLVPIRPAGTDPGLPIDGRGGFEWRGFEPFAHHPQGINPPNGQIVNWNNRAQHGYQPGDDNWALGAEQRVSLLTRPLGSRRGLTLAALTSAMNQGATQDVRAVLFEPALAAMLRRSAAPSPRETQMLGLLDGWRASGGSRLDRDGDGKIDNAGAAIMDAAWDRLANAWADPVIGPQVDRLASLVRRYDKPPGGQFGGWHIWMDKDLRTLLGQRVQGGFSTRYCGGGNVATCSQSLWAALQAAGDELAATQGPDPAAWRADANPERIKFVPGLLPFTMRYTNRPTGIQQLLTFGGHGPRQ